MTLNKFKSRQYEDFEIVDEDGAKICEIRVKPSGIQWAPKGAKGDTKWYGVTLTKFAEFMVANGKRKKH